MKNYSIPSMKYWKGRESDDNAYWFNHIRISNILNPSTDLQSSISILGYACDEGVRRNHGRVGAVDGPNEIRKSVAKMAWHLQDKKIYDCGNITCLDANMEESQESLAISIEQLLTSGSFPIVLGGGHDISYGHYNGIKKYLDKRGSVSNIGIINFDAHFDLRKINEKGNSGTPFYQIAQSEIKRGRPILYLPIGIQKEANTVSLFETAKDFGVQHVSIEEFTESTFYKLNSFIEYCDVIYLTIDMDVFSSTYAPGVSAPSPMGYRPHQVFSLLRHIMSCGKVMSMDIAELNPLYDREGMTAKLASRIISIVAESHYSHADII